MNEPKLRKVTVEIEILMEVEESIDGMSLHQIESECLDGGWSYAWKQTKDEIIEGDEAIQKACNAQGTDPSFFYHEYE